SRAGGIQPRRPSRSAPVSSRLRFSTFSSLRISSTALAPESCRWRLTSYYSPLYFRCRTTSKRTLEEITREPGNSFGHRRDRVHRRGHGRGVTGARAPRAGAGPPGGRPVEATPGTGG